MAADTPGARAAKVRLLERLGWRVLPLRWADRCVAISFGLTFWRPSLASRESPLPSKRARVAARSKGGSRSRLTTASLSWGVTRRRLPSAPCSWRGGDTERHTALLRALRAAGADRLMRGRVEAELHEAMHHADQGGLGAGRYAKPSVGSR